MSEFEAHSYLPKNQYAINITRPFKSFLKVALDGRTRPGDTLQILPLALAPPNKPSALLGLTTSHSVLRGHPSLTHRVGFFRGIHSQKIIIGTAIFFPTWMSTLIIYIYIYIYISLI